MTPTEATAFAGNGFAPDLAAIHPSWRLFIDQQMSTPKGQLLTARLREAAHDGMVIYPSKEDIFRVFHASGPADIRVVILGQDPYHGPGQAMGLSFSVPTGVRLPPSLRNILKEAPGGDLSATTDGDLSHWSAQGVFLLNAALTVEAGKAGAHAKWGWHGFTDNVVAHISAVSEATVFLLWGKHAQGKIGLIDDSKHLVLTAPHPSPLSAHRGFLGCGHFTRTNDWLGAKGYPKIRW
ncbi:MAG: uracil-DNA glycosylase [Pseudomonadota bacterium]